MRFMAVAVVVLVTVGCGGQSGTPETASPSAGAASGDDRAAVEPSLQEQFADISRGDRGAEWELLHPAHQSLISKERWVQCNSGRSLQLQVRVLEAERVRTSLPALGESDAWQLKIDITRNISETVETGYRAYAY